MNCEREKCRILLFGRTGSGKSTIANMLARGHLDPPLLFKTSSGVRGETLSMQREECEQMVIVDTVGLGESEHGRVSTQEAQRILYNFFRNVEEGFHVFAFVRKWGRNDVLDEQLWKFFRQAFKGAEENFLVIFTHFDRPQAELEVSEIKKSLMQMYAPCQTWVYVDFPDDSEGGSVVLSEALSRMRLRRHTRSLERLTQAMVQLEVPPVAPDVCSHFRVGRVLLVGRRPTAIAILANLLVKDDLHFLDSDLPFPTAGISADAATSSQPFTEGKGRRWEVVAMHCFDFYIGAHQGFQKTWAASLLKTLMHEGGFSHVIFVHESGHTRHQQDELIDQSLWQMMLAFLSKTMRKERLVLVIAASNTSPASLTTEIARFKDCQNLVSLDITSEVDARIDQGKESDLDCMKCFDRKRLDSARRALEQVLQKEVGTQSTLFNLDINLSDRARIQQIIEKISGIYLNPVVRAVTPAVPFNLLSNAWLDQMSSAYRKIVNKDVSWDEQQAEAVEEASAAEAEAAAHDGAANNPLFCKSTQFVVGEGLNLLYLKLNCGRCGTPRCIKVTVESHDQGHLVEGSRPRDQAGTYVDSHTWGELGAGESGERVEVYANRPADNKWQRHIKEITDPSFLRGFESAGTIALFLRSSPGWCNYTRYASIKLIYS